MQTPFTFCLRHLTHLSLFLAFEGRPGLSTAVVLGPGHFCPAQAGLLPWAIFAQEKLCSGRELSDLPNPVSFHWRDSPGTLSHAYLHLGSCFLVITK